ncbi:MAG TPA: GNAT family N-acetyltransferase [Gaiellaceae bacterium]|nr:GNAT family N-acetyltransferase [Gaiellaceae bacterium]
MSDVVRPLRADEYEAFLERALVEYAADMVRAGVEPAVARAKSERDHATLLSDGVDTPGHSLYAIVDGGERVGYLWLAERDAELGRSLFVYAIRVDEPYRRRGLGRAAMVFAEEEARRRGFARIGLNVFSGNDVARGLYASLGYRETATYMEKAL